MDNLQFVGKWEERFSKVIQYFVLLSILLIIYIYYSQTKDYIVFLIVNAFFLFLNTRNRKCNLYTDGINMYISKDEEKVIKVPFNDGSVEEYKNYSNSMNDNAFLFLVFLLNIFITILDLAMF